MSEEKKMIINEKDFVACNYFEACDYFKQLKRLQEENEELKKYQHTQEYLQGEIEKRQQALEEISILAKNYCNACDEFKVKTFKNKNDCLYCNYGFIRRKINEVLNDR